MKKLTFVFALLALITLIAASLMKFMAGDFESPAHFALAFLGPSCVGAVLGWEKRNWVRRYSFNEKFISFHLGALIIFMVAILLAIGIGFIYNTVAILIGVVVAGIVWFQTILGGLSFSFMLNTDR